MNQKSRSNLSSFIAPGAPTYERESRETRLRLVQFFMPKFNPTCINSFTEPFTYTREWYDSLSGDERNNIYWSALFPERINSNWTDRIKYNPVEFNTLVTPNNARDWYAICPAHLRKRIDEAIQKAPAPDKVISGEDYDAVKFEWGDRPKLRNDEDVHMAAWQEEWDYAYRDQVLRRCTAELAPSIQNERKLLNQTLGIDTESGDLPNQADGLDPTVAATVRWLQASGEMPLEFLARTYRSEEAKMSDRLTAARTLMDYVHRRVPAKQEIETKDVGTPKLDPSTLSGLSAKELETLEKLLAKLSQNG